MEPINKGELKYFHRCFDLAKLGGKYARPNPKVGAVIVYNGRIIGEGYHKKHGAAHAEVNAVNSVSQNDIHLLNKSTIYISLEPCHHYGSTPPCVDLILKLKIPRVYIALTDPTEKVYYKSIKKLRSKGVEVILADQNFGASDMISEFRAIHMNQRPFVQIKLAKSLDNYIGQDDQQIQLTNALSNVYTHKLRAYTDAILIGTNTAVIDNPSLSLRNYPGDSPMRIVLDRSEKIPKSHQLINDNEPTIIITDSSDYQSNKHKEIIQLDFNSDTFILDLLYELKHKGINHIMVEGGASVIKSFINANLWDEAIIISTTKKLMRGTKAPQISGRLSKEFTILKDSVQVIKNQTFDQLP